MYEVYAPAQVEDLPVRITTVHDSAKVEHFGSIVDLRPEPVLQSLFLRFKCCRRLDEVEMRKNGDNLGKTMGGKR